MLRKLFGKPKKQSKNRRDVSLDSAKEIQVISIVPTNLPPRFAEQLLHLEMEMELDSVDLTNVKKLLELYASAVEYYESVKSEKYYIFKNKTQALLLKPNVSSAMIREQMKNSKQSLTPVVGSSKQFKFDEIEENCESQQKQVNIVLTQQQKEHNLKVQYINSQPSQENAKIMLNQHEQEQHQTKHIISGQIETQTNDVLRRLEIRRKSKLEKTLNLEKLQISVDEESEKQKHNDSFEIMKREYEESLSQKTKVKELSEIFGALKQKQEMQTIQNSSLQSEHCLSESEEEKSSEETNSSFKELGFISPQRKQDIQRNTENVNHNITANNKNNSGKKNIDSLVIKKNTEATYHTPDKENNIYCNNQIDPSYQWFCNISNSNVKKNTHFRNISNNSNGRNDSPVTVKLNSYGKENSKSYNFNWMTAATNNFHNSFNMQ